MYEFMCHLRRKPVPSYVLKLHENFFFPIDDVNAEVVLIERALGVQLPSK